MTRRPFLSILFLALFFFSQTGIWAQDFSEPKKTVLTLKDCLELASKNNSKLSAMDYAVEGSKWRYEETQIRFKPIIEYVDRMAPAPRDANRAIKSLFSGDATFFNSGKIAVGLPVYAFGQIDTAERLAGKGVEAAKQEKIKEETRIYFEIKQLYYGILLGRELKSLASDALNKINDQLRKEEETHKHSPYDILKLKIFRSDLERRLTEVEAKEAIAIEALRIHLGLSQDQPFGLADTHLEISPQKMESLDHYVSKAIEARPDVDLIDIGYETKRLEYKLENRKVFPRIGIGSFFEIGRTVDPVHNVRVSDDFNDPFNYTRAGFGLEIKGTLDIHGSLTRIKRLENEYHRVTMERATAKEGIELDVKRAYEDVKSTLENLSRSEDKAKMARQMMFLSKSNLDIGVGEEQQYTDALQLVLQSRGEYFKAMFDYNVALAKLEEKTGWKYENIQ